VRGTERTSILSHHLKVSGIHPRGSSGEEKGVNLSSKTRMKGGEKSCPKPTVDIPSTKG